MREETEDAKPVADRDGDDAARRHALAVIPELRAVSRHEATTIEVHEHGQSGVRACAGRSPDVEIEAILAYAGVAEHHVGVDARLHALVRKTIGRAYTLPSRRWLRRLPTQLAHRRRGERNA